MGGECPYYACVPTKMMVRAAGLLAEGHRVPGMAGEATLRPEWAPVAARIRDEATDSWDDKVAVDRLTGKGVRVVHGRGRLTASDEVAVNGQVFRARKGIVLNTGTSPAAPPIDGLAGTPFWTNREAVQATEAPASLLVLGGGVVGVEMAQVFSRFDSRVTVVEAADRLLLNEEPGRARCCATSSSARASASAPAWTSPASPTTATRSPCTSATRRSPPSGSSSRPAAAPT